jgi:hypothetical protein
VYFDSLAQLGETRTRRHQQPIARLPERGDAALFVFGLAWREFAAEQDEFNALETFVRGGGRLVVTLYPERTQPRQFVSGQGSNAPVFKSPLQEEMRRPPINLREEWGFGLDYIPLPRQRMTLLPVKAVRVIPADVPAELSWHSALVFTNLDSSWRVVYARDSRPVMIERMVGAGTIVLATDSFFVSNEAMRSERSPALLSWLPGRSREIVFDETHLGVIERAGVAVLARRYRLHGTVLALIGLALLFIWKNSMSFVPRPSDSATATPVLGRESAAGFQSLLRRSLPPGELLQACLDEWHKAAALDPRASAARRARMRTVVEAHNAAEKPNLVDTYREIARLLNQKK